MLRSAGYFSHFSCPFEARGCRRPYCQYRHDAGRREEPLPAQQPLRGSPAALGPGKNIRELERLSKAIQSVKTEVEEKQKKLLYYNVAQDNPHNSLTPAENDIGGSISFSDEDGLSLTKDTGHANSISKDSKSDKYILDHSCPATDLEYDPLLNYTAGVVRSSFKEEDKNNKQHLKHVKMFTSRNLKGSTKKVPCENRYGSPRKRSRSSSPIKVEIKLQESDDDVLIIDDPPVNVSKKLRISRASKKLKEREENQVSWRTKADIQQNFEITGSLNCMERKRQEDTTVAVDHVNQSDGKKIEIKSLTSESTYLLDVNVNTLNTGSKAADPRKCCLPTKSNNSSQIKTEINRKVLKDVSVKVVSTKTFSVEQQLNNHNTLNSKTQTNICSEDNSKDGAAQVSSKKIPDNLEKWNIQPHEKSEGLNNSQSPLSYLSEDVFVDTDLLPENSEDRCSNKITCMHTKENEKIIVLDSSEEDDSAEDTEISDSDDTMEECRRIFNEFVEHEAQKEEMAKQVSNRRRPSLIPELGSKVPHDIRQRYVNFFVEEFLKVCTTVNEAFDKALIEEKAIYDRCGCKNMYLNIAVNTLKKLRDHGSASSDNFTGIALYRLLKDYVLTEEQLKENDYPEPNPEKPGTAMLFSCPVKPAISDTSKRVCCRCGEIYTVTSSGKHVRKEECNYHSGRVVRHKVPGGLETRYSCCEGVIGSPGCQVAKVHVHDGRNENLDGFVKTFIKPPLLDGNHGVFALDCEMCYTTRGLELSRVTVVDPSLQIAYDTFVKPDNEIIDYNTRFSGVTAEDMKNTMTSIRDVQAILLNLFSADTILIGHSLENDLFALKLFHNTIVDTSVVFPHRLGLPHKRALRNLMADYLRRIIQDNVGGHDSSEDATACMELMLWKVKEDTKGRR
ncbi:hypothetical protein lerEdw1_000065 [Lerista edwardsae]|nr:hypothetical protein lerEdw1_000065 [Lerista edwardsae]